MKLYYQTLHSSFDVPASDPHLIYVTTPDPIYLDGPRVVWILILEDFIGEFGINSSRGWDNWPSWIIDSI